MLNGPRGMPPRAVVGRGVGRSELPLRAVVGRGRRDDGGASVGWGRPL